MAETNETNILDAENLINGSTVQAPEDIDIERPELLDQIDVQLSDAKAQALTIQEGLNTKLEEEKLAREKANETKDLGIAKEGQKTFLEKILAGAEDTRADVREKEEERVGLTEKEQLLSEQATKVAGIQEEIDTLEVRRQSEIDRVYDRQTAMGNIRAETSELDRLYDSKKAYLAAQLSGSQL